MIKEAIRQDMYTAMKNQDHNKKDILSFMLGNIQKVEKDKNVILSDDEVISVIRKEIKQREETLEYAKKAESQNIIDECNFAINTLNQYVPQMMDENAIKDFLSTVFVNIDPIKSNKGKIMKEVSALKGKADMKMVSQLVDKNLK